MPPPLMMPMPSKRRRDLESRTWVDLLGDCGKVLASPAISKMLYPVDFWGMTKLWYFGGK